MARADYPDRRAPVLRVGAMWFELLPVDLVFTQRSRERIVNQGLVRAPAAHVCATFLDRMPEWMREVRDVRWTTPEPRGIGTQRTVVLDAMSARETFLAWSPGERVAFRIDELTIPLLDAMVEDLTFEPRGDDACFVTWTVHYKSRWFAKPLSPLAKGLFRKMFSVSFEKLTKMAEQK